MNSLRLLHSSGTVTRDTRPSIVYYLLGCYNFLHMKTFKVTITAELQVPDDFELADDPRDKLLCLKRAAQYFHPTIQWMQRKHDIEIGIVSNFEGQPDVGWQSVDDDMADELFNASIRDSDDVLTEEYSIEQL
jgi:hypothetical protein